MVEQKEIASIEILYLDEIGYGPEGKHTRRQWRAECLTNLLAGKDQFLAWQESWKALAEKNDRKVSFGLVISYQDGTKNNHAAEIYSARVSHALDFCGSRFELMLDCDLFHFQFDSLFDFALFSGGAAFSASQFSSLASFISSRFLGIAGFYDSQFLDVVYCIDLYFLDEAYFTGAQFSGDSYFNAAKFIGNAYFSKVSFTSFSYFSYTNFGKTACFENASFANLGNFEHAEFEKRIPAFRGCKIDATRLEFSNESHFTQADYSENAIKNISFLKRLSDHHGQVDQALEFNAMELRAKRQHRLESLKSGDWGATHATWVYEHVSDFGRSFTKPLKGYLALLAVTWSLALVCAVCHAPQLCSGEASGSFVVELARYNTCENPDAVRPPKQLVFTGYTAASEYTLYRASGFIHFADKGKQVHDINRRLFNSPVEPWFMRLWGLVTSLLSTIFFFFIALGLRNRYRIK